MAPYLWRLIFVKIYLIGYFDKYQGITRFRKAILPIDNAQLVVAESEDMANIWMMDLKNIYI